MSGLQPFSQVPPARMILFGNSLTYFNNGLNDTLKDMVDSVGGFGDFEALCCTLSGGMLQDHRFAFEGILRTRPLDTVVLQGHSAETMRRSLRDGFFTYGGLFAKIAHEMGLRTALYMTWAYTDKPEMTERLEAAYVELGEKTDSVVVPVGLAFAAARGLESAPPLLIHDGIHPAPAGTYLAACVFYATLFGASPEGLPALLGVPSAACALLQAEAWRTVRDFRQRRAG